MENKIDKYYFTSKNNNEYIIYFIQRNDNEYEIYFDLKDNELNGIEYKKTNLFEPFEVFRNVCWKINNYFYKYPNIKHYIKIFNEQFRYIYDYVVQDNGYCLFYDVEIKDDYMIFTRNDVTIP